MQRRIKLWGLQDVVLIVLEPSGVLHENQVMGHACVQASAEGVLAPLSPDYPTDDRGRPVVDTLAERLGHLTLNWSHIAAPMADRVDSILSEYRETSGITLDRDRLRESGEAWLYVCISAQQDFYLQGFGDCKGVLTWANSD